MNTLSLFSGIGAFEKSLTRMKAPVDLIGFSEGDKYAVKSYCAIHNVDESKNLGDITKIDETALPRNIDLITYGFPCQDISLAGKQKGLFNEDGTQTRSGLFFEALRIIEATQPRVAIAENVKNLTSQKFAEQFKIVLESLEDAGYNNYWQVLNAKDYGIPQNRERVFIVSIRKDIDNGTFKIPEGFPLELRLKDMLEDEIDEKYYIDISKVPKLFEVCCYKEETDGICPTTDSCSGGNRVPKVSVREATKKGYAEAVEGDSINLEQPNSKTRRGRVGHGVAQTLTTSPQQGVVVYSEHDQHAELLNYCVEMAKQSFAVDEKIMYLIDRMDLIEREEKVCICEQKRNQYINHLNNICDLYAKSDSELTQIYSLNINQHDDESIDYIKECLQQLFEEVDFCE